MNTCLISTQVKCYAKVFQDVGVFRLVIYPALKCFNSVQQDQGIEWFRDVIISPESETNHLINLAGRGRQQHNRKASGFITRPKFTTDIKPIAIGEYSS